MIEQLAQKIIETAIAICDNAAPLPDGNAIIPWELHDQLGEAFVALRDWEERHGSDLPLSMEVKVRAADELYIAAFDEVIVPGQWYRLNALDYKK